MKTSGAGSSGSGLTVVPVDLKPDEELDFGTISDKQCEFWTTCSTCFPFGHTQSYPVHIDQLEIAPDKWIIRTLEPEGIKKQKTYLTYLPDINMRQTICIMPKNLKEMPTSWEQIKNGKFYIINGQHSVLALMELQRTKLDPGRKKALRTWKAYVIWTMDPNLSVMISEFFNLVNHLIAFQPTWGQNIMASRNVWKDYGCPLVPGDVNYEVRIRSIRANFLYIFSLFKCTSVLLHVCHAFIITVTTLMNSFASVSTLLVVR